MTRMQQIIFAANSFSTGILLPVLTLALLEKGANLQTLPLLLAVYSLTVLCLELPSGILADIYGRKAVFLLSCGFLLISFSILFAADNIVCLIFAIVFLGLGRAFSSGSLDALLIDQALAVHGEGCLVKVTARLSVLESGGLALGSIAGGLISNAAHQYTSNIVLRLVFTIVLFTLSLIFIKEQPSRNIKREKQRTSLIELVRQGKQVIFSTPKFALILIGIFFTGFFLTTVEAYWQPAFIKITATGSNISLLGFITFLGFFTVILGNSIAQRLLNRLKNSWWNIYNICRIIMAAIIIAFAFQKGIFGYVSFYAGIYLLLGAGNVTESTLINTYTPDSMRASVLSLNSLVAQIGGFCASLFCSITVMHLQFSGVWIVAGILVGGYAIVVVAVTNKSSRKKSNNSVAISPPDA